MLHNDVLRSLRFLLDVNEVGMANLFHLGGLDLPMHEVEAYLRREDEPGFVVCPDRSIAAFLDGLVVSRRGARDEPIRRMRDERITNNAILKSLRIAFSLRDDDLLRAMDRVGVRLSKSELSALFRQPSHPNYRVCGDQFLRTFLRALATDPRFGRAT